MRLPVLNIQPAPGGLGVRRVGGGADEGGCFSGT